MSLFADFDAIQVGETRSISRIIGADDVRRFVELTGDDNPLHVDADFAETTSFKDIVVHGMLGASFISTVIGTKLPGPGALWVSQNVQFLLPVRIGDTLTIQCTVLRKHERERLLDLDTRILNQHGQAVVTGEGRVKVLVERKPAAVAGDASRPRVALVTGGSGGIGRAACEALAGAGHHVAIHCGAARDRAEALAQRLRDAGGTAHAFAADLADPQAVVDLHDSVIRRMGSVDVLVANAAPRVGAKPLAQMDWTDVQRQIDVQVRSAFLLAQRAAPAMAERRFGRIVCVTSQAAEGSPTVGWTGYAVAKSALGTLARQLAAELGPSGVTVNCVAPGMTETAMIGDIPEKAQMMLARQTPLRRLAVPQDVAGAIAWLASDAAAYVTGQTLRVNGGTVMA